MLYCSSDIWIKNIRIKKKIRRIYLSTKRLSSTNNCKVNSSEPTMELTIFFSIKNLKMKAQNDMVFNFQII